MNQYIVLWNETNWVTPIIEIYNYSDEYALINKWIEKVVFNSSVFVPMFLFWLNKIQKLKNNWKIINLPDILKMLKTNYSI